MEKKVKNLVKSLRQKRDKADILQNNTMWGIENVAFQRGRAKAFDEIAQELQDILYSENPNSVSNQPLQD